MIANKQHENNESFGIAELLEDYRSYFSAFPFGMIAKRILIYTLNEYLHAKVHHATRLIS